MPKSHREMLDDLKELRNAGSLVLDVIEGEFNSILEWLRDIQKFIKSKDFSPCDLQALFPIPKVSKDATKNNNESSCSSLENSPPTIEEENLNESTITDTDLQSPSVDLVQLTDPVTNTKRLPTRSSRRINSNIDPKQVEEANGMSSNSKSSSVDNSLTDPVKKSKRVPTRSSHRINRNTGHKEDVTLNESSASSSSSESSSSVAVRVTAGQKIESAQIEPSSHLISVIDKPGPASKKLLRGTPTLSGPGPGKKALKGTPSMAGPRAEKKVLKGTPSMAGPRLVKKVLKGTPSMAGPRAVKKVLKGTPSMAGPGLAQNKLLRGTPTSSRDGLALRKLFNETEVKSKAQRNLVGIEDGPFRRSDYVHDLAQKGFSHLAKLKDLLDPDRVTHDSLVKRTTVVEDPRKTFVIAPFDERNATFVVDSARSSNGANATFVIDSSDVIQNAKEKVLKGLENLAVNQDLVETGGIAHVSNKTISVVKDLNATFDVASYDMTLDPDERRPLPSKNEDDYGLDDVCSDDSSDDESNPKKVVPEWAQEANRLPHLCMQYLVSQSQMFAFFGSAKTTPDLTKLFSTSNIDKRILIRRSSAVWDSPNKNGK